LTLVDANILLYAYNSDAAEHTRARAWVEDAFNGTDLIGLPWMTIWAFLRVSTNPRLWPNPRPAADVFAIISEWLALPNAVTPQPGPRHAEILEKLVIEHRATGSLVSDAVLAALALENGATLASTDQDFRRFPSLRWINPLE
jgi:uncharacterized protein